MKKITKNELLAIKDKLAKEGKSMSPNSNLIREYKSTLNGLTQEQKDAGIGHLLGDARIERGKSSQGHLLKFEYGDNNREYAFDAYRIFSDYCLTGPRKQKRINVNGNDNVT